MLRYANGFLFLGRVEKRDCGGGVVCFLAMMARMDRFGNGYLWNFATGFLIYIFFSHIFLFKLVLKGSKVFWNIYIVAGIFQFSCSTTLRKYEFGVKFMPISFS